PGTKLITQVYDISEIVGAAANFEPTQTQTGGQGGGGGGGSISQSTGNTQGTENAEQLMSENTDDIVTIIQETIAPESWLINGGEGTIIRTTNSYTLIISQSPQVHLQIQKLMDDLRDSKGIQVAIE